MQSILIRNTYRLKNKLTLFFNQYKIVILFSALMLILGLALGIYTTLKYSGEIELSNLSDIGFVEFLKGDKGVVGLFFSYMFKFLFCISIIIYLNFKPILSVCSYLLLIVRGYLIGFDLTAIILLYGFAGVLNVLIVIIPFELIVCMVLIAATAIATNRNFNLKRFGESSYCSRGCFNCSKTYLLLVVIGVLALLFRCLLMPLIRVTIIVN